MSRKYVTGSCAAALALVLVLSARPAVAGFEWVAPQAPAESDVTAQALPPASVSAPTPAPQSAMPDIISPVIITGTPAAPQATGPYYAPPPAAPAPLPLAPAPASAPQALPLSSAPQAPLPAVSAAPQPAPDIVQGFAKDLPLTLALRQILPVGYSYVIAADVDAGQLVSYKGGQSWRETLRDMLAAHDLAATERGTTITIARRAAPAQPALLSPESQPAPAHAASAPHPVIDTGVAASGAPLPLAGPAPIPAPAPVYVPPAPAYQPPVARNVPSFDVAAGGWSAERGQTLREVLGAWCKRAGVQMQWVAEYDYPLQASARFQGDFQSAVRGLLAGFQGANPQPVAELHNDPAAGQKLLVVMARGNSTTN